MGGGQGVDTELPPLSSEDRCSIYALFNCLADSFSDSGVCFLFNDFLIRSWKYASHGHNNRVLQKIERNSHLSSYFNHVFDSMFSVYH